MNVAANRRLADRYRLTGRIAAGGMGEVWQAHDDVLDRTVAVKLLRAEFAADAGYLKRFRDEARHAAALSHPGIASVYDYGEVDGQPFLVLEYVPGDSLATLLARAGGPLSVPQALDIVGQAALALQAAHEAGIVHRDVKPANLLVRPDGLVKVTDFGIARPAGAPGGDAADVVEGTAYYLAPEQIAGRPATAASDVYSLGIVAYEALAGRHAFDGPDPAAVARARLQLDPPALPATVPPRVGELVAAALDRDPQRRPSSAAAFGRRALALAAEPTPPAGAGDASATTRVLPVEPEPTIAFAPGAIPPEQRRVRNRLLAAGAAVVLLGAVLIWLATALSGGPRTVTISPSAYVGRPAATVEPALRRLGVKVAQRDTPSRAARGTVLQVSPSGSVPVGSTVGVTVAVPAASTPTPTPTPIAPTPAAPAAPAPGPPGHGPGHGHPGKGD